MASLVFLAGAGYAYYAKQKEWKEQLAARIEEEHLDFESTIPIKLTPFESSNLALLNHPISRITFFKKEHKLDPTMIQEKVMAILRENPWLTGFVAQRPEDTEMQLYYDPTEDITVAAERTYAYVDQSSSKLSRNISTYSEWLVATEDYRVASSTDVLNRKSKPLFKVTVMDCSDESDGDGSDSSAGEQALVVSMCQICGDYHTFYKLHNMLMTPGTVLEVKLNPFRHPDFVTHAAQLLGAEEVGYFRNTNAAIWEKSKENTSNEVLAFTVSNEWLEAQPHYKDRNNIGGSSSGEGDDDNTTTLSSKTLVNVIGATVISWFFNLVQPAVGFCPTNLRDYLDIIDDYDAGNYQNPIPLTPPDYATPALVQQSLQSGKRSSPEPLPKFFSADSGLLTFALGANQMVVPESSSSSSSADQDYDLHMPLIYVSDLKRMPFRVSGMVMFWAKPNIVGVYCVCKKADAEKIIQAGIIDETLSML